MGSGKRSRGNPSRNLVDIIPEEQDVDPALLSWECAFLRKVTPVFTTATVSCESPEAVLLNGYITSLVVCGVDLDVIEVVFDDRISEGDSEQ
jgi:hypothetical protein